MRINGDEERSLAGAGIASSQATTAPLDPKSSSWPQLVGMLGTDAGEALARALPGADVVLIPEGAAVTMDYRLNRVRIFVTDRSESGTVVRAPARG
ncbi:MAG: hypothetical protein WDW38_003966 [Sanguina aurantia]